MLEFLKPFFGDKSLSFEQLQEAVGQSDVKPVNLSDGNYVSKDKYDAEIRKKDESIETLKQTSEKHKNDLSELKNLLEKAGTNETELKNTLGKISEMEQRAEQDKADFDKRLEQTRRDAAVKVFASDIDFSSKTAKKGFIEAFLATNPEIDGDTVKGGEDFLKKYMEDDPNAFNKSDEENGLPYIVDRKKPKPKPEPFNLTKTMIEKNRKE